MATKDRTALKDEFKNGNLATGERFADLIDSMKVVQLPVVDPQALGTSLSFIDSISQDADGKITATKKTLDLANAHELNPFKGWYKTGDTLPTDGFDGAYLYFKDTSELTGQTTIYRWNGTAYADTGTVVDTSNVQTFGSGQALNAVKIKDENGEEVIGDAGVLSAEAGLKILVAKAINRGYVNPVNGTITQDGNFLVSEFIPFLTDLYFYQVYVGSTIGLCFYDKYQKFIGHYNYATEGTQDIVLAKSSYPNVAFVRFSTTSSNNGWCRMKSVDGLINNISSIINDITSVYGDFFNVPDSLLKTDGTFANVSGRFGTDFIPVDITKPLTLYAFSGGTTYQTYTPICFYDKNHSCLGHKSVSGTAGNVLLEIDVNDYPEGTVYIRSSSSGRVGFIVANTLSAFITDIYKIVSDKSIRYTENLSDDDYVQGCIVYYNPNTGEYQLAYGKGNSSYANYKRTRHVRVNVGDVMHGNPYQGSVNFVNVITDADLNVLRTFKFVSATHEFTEEDLAGGGVYAIVSYYPASQTTGYYCNIERTFDIANYTNKVDKEIKNRPRIPNYAFRSIAPSAFKDKLMSMDDDVNILLLGDSMTALTNVAGDVFPNAANLPAGCNRNAITYQLWNRLCTNKPQCDRFDSTVNQFAETGTWSLSDLDKFKKNAYGTTTEETGMGEFSDDNCITRETTTTGDSVSFEWNLSDYEKLNFIHRLSAYDGTTGVTIAVTQGNGNVEVYDRNSSSWVEANGYVFSQKLSATDSGTSHDTYTACWIRNYPLKMRRKSGASGNVTLTFTNTGNGTFYYWGTERYNFTTVRITNIARAGRNLNLLWRNIGREVTLRDVDLIIFQLPLWNDFKVGGDVLDTTVEPELNGIISDLSTYSTIDNTPFAKFQVIFNLYHTQSFSWEGNKNIQYYANGDRTKTPTNLPDYQLETKIEKILKDLISSNYEGKLSVANLNRVFYQIALSNGISMEEFLSQYNYDFGVKPFTIDGVHLTSVGHNYYAELIAPMLE